MVCFPNAKINLGLQVIGKRADGFHDLETIFYPINLRDALEILPTTHQDVRLYETGLTVHGNLKNNLCVRAYQLLKNHFPELPGVDIHLHKIIPMGAGMGGGSADGSFTLKLLRDMFNLNATDEQLMNWSVELGSDCPFFIMNKPCHASGRGERLTPIKIDSFAEYKILIVNPGIHINTSWAFGQLEIQTKHHNLQESISMPIEIWKDCIYNDFEEVVLMAHPTLKSIKEKLIEAGAVYASMSGSGSTFYGIFHQSCNPMIAFPETYFCKWV